MWALQISWILFCRFYTLVPHDFGVENPPLLNNDEIIKTKSSMLDSLIEMEIAYKLLNTGTYRIETLNIV